MTDEEMAKEYVKGEVPFDSTESGEKLYTEYDLKQAFLAGLKAKTQWHDINEIEPSKEQLGKQLLIRMKSVIGDTDYDYLVYKYAGESIADVPDVIAWCEIKE